MTEQETETEKRVRRAILLAFEHRHEVVDIAYDSQTEDDAIARIAQLLDTDPVGARAVLDQSLRRFLPQKREDLRQRDASDM